MTGNYMYGGDFVTPDPIENEDEVIYSNKHYDVYVGDPEINFDRGGLVYKVVNRQYSVLELETPSLPRALWDADEFDTHLSYHAKSVASRTTTVNLSGDDEITEEQLEQLVVADGPAH